MSLYRGKSKTLRVTAVPKDAEYTIVWSSKDKSIASVDKNGKVTGKKKGKTTITATINNKKYTCKVEVLVKNPAYGTVAKKAKAMQSKDIKYDNIDIGNHAKLWGKSLYAVWGEDLLSYLYLIKGGSVPYIDISKSEGKSHIKLKMESKLYQYSFDRYGIEYDQLIIYSVPACYGNFRFSTRI